MEAAVQLETVENLEQMQRDHVADSAETQAATRAPRTLQERTDGTESEHRKQDLLNESASCTQFEPVGRPQRSLRSHGESDGK